MTSRHVPLLPTGPPPITTSGAEQHGAHSATKSYIRRQMTQNACLGCRKKRTKCDGKSPCSRCVGRGERCEYKNRTSISKHDLRAEVEMLKRERINSRAVLDALLLDRHESIVQRLRAGEPVDAIAQSLSAKHTAGPGDAQHMGGVVDGVEAVDRAGVHGGDDDDDDDDDEEDEQDRKGGILDHDIAAGMALPPKGSRSARDAYASNVVGIKPKNRSQILAEVVKKFEAGLFDSPISAIDGHDGASDWRRSREPSVAALPPPVVRPRPPRRHSFGVEAVTFRDPALGSSIWTNVTSSTALELFLRDYHSGGRQFCSPALVNALASVATRYLEHNESNSPADAHLLGEQFFNAAKGMLVLEAQVSNLPSIQTLALLAVREMSCGREREAQDLCLRALRLLSALDYEDLEGHGAGRRTDHLTVRCITYAGVLALTRAIWLITDQLSPASTQHYPTAPLMPTVAWQDGEYLAIQLQRRMDALQRRRQGESQQTLADVLSVFIFEQTEYVYSFLSLANGRGDGRAFAQLPIVYQRCLESYETVTNYLQQQGDSTPSTLFVHIYFHFCLLALFRPVIHSAMDVGGVPPRTICAEAVQAILDVTQSYASLFTLRCTPCFVPYFVFAAGLTRIVLERGSTPGSSPSPSASASAPTSAPSTTGWSPRTGDAEVVDPAYPQQLFDEDQDRNRDTSMSGTEEPPNLFSPDFAERTGSPGTSPATATTRTMSTASTSGTTSTSEGGRSLTQAVLQLQGMSVGHPAAAQAEWVLRDIDPNQQG